MFLSPQTYGRHKNHCTYIVQNIFDCFQVSHVLDKRFIQDPSETYCSKEGVTMSHLEDFCIKRV